MKKKKFLIPEEKYLSDFSPLAGFYDYHIKSKGVEIPLEIIQGLGVNLIPKRQNDVAKIQDNDINVNTIVFSSSKKKHNVKNLAWCIRCLVSHPENIEIVNVDNRICYRLRCSKKKNNTDKYITTMKGLIDCAVWSDFVKKWMDTIKENEECHEAKIL